MATRPAPSALDAWRARLDLGLDELVSAATELLEQVAPTQARWKVTARPDARTVRYYVTRGLLPKPLGYDGGRARYGFTHLLRLLFIKQQQADQLSLRQVAARLEGATDADLEASVGAALTGARPAPMPARPRRVVRAVGQAPAPASARRPPSISGAVARVVVELPGGARLELDPTSLEDDAARTALASHLETFARSLRDPGVSPTRPEEDPDER